MMRQANHNEEHFFLDNFNIDRVFNSIKRADYLVLYYIQSMQEQKPEARVYLSDLAKEMDLRTIQLSKAMEKLQDKGFVMWKTDRSEGRTYVELTSKAVELMAAERAWIKRCYDRIRSELGDEELARTVNNLQRISSILSSTE